MKLPLFQTTPVPGQKQTNASSASTPGASLGSSTQNRLWLLGLVSFLTIFSLLTVFTRTTTTTTRHQLLDVVAMPTPTTTARAETTPVPSASLDPVLDALVHYALTSNSTSKMRDGDLLALSAAIRRRSPCNLLVFGLSHEALLWRSLNHGGRTVFVDESDYFISLFESRHPDAHIEAYDVAYATKVRDLESLMAATRELRRTDCRPVQNLLFSDCRLGISDLPNYIYDIAWDVILVDGPSGYSPDAPGRMAAIFTAGVLARSGAAAAGGSKVVDVFVHDYFRETEKLSSEEYLCAENLKLVSPTGQLAHFTIENRKSSSNNNDSEFEFCLNNQTEDNLPSSSATNFTSPTTEAGSRRR